MVFSVEEDIKQLLQNSPIGIAILERGTGSRLFANDMLAKMLGADSSDNLLERDIRETWIRAEDLEQARAAIESHGQLVNFEAERRKLDGSRWWVLMNSQPYPFEGRDADIIWHIDITDRKNHERTAGNLFLAIESLQQGVSLFDAEDRLVYINEAWRKMNGSVPENHVPGTTFAEHLNVLVEKGLAPDAHGQEDKWIAERLHRHRHPSGVFEIQRNDVHLLVHEQRLPDGGVATLYTDITELKLAQKHLERALVEAERANQAKSEFLACMSHELRTPLNAIIGFSEMVSQEMLGPIGNTAYREYLQDIHHSGHHLLHLVNDMLDLEKIECGEMTLYENDIGLDDLLSYCLRMVKSRKEASKVSFLFDTPGDLPQVRVDERRFKQIVLNLLANAVRFNKEGGRVTLAVRRDSEKDISICVEDTGLGISEKDLPLVTEPFGQVRSNAHVAHEGTGLGLSLSKQLIQLHGGSLEIESEIGIGTAVTIRLPAERVVTELQ